MYITNKERYKLLNNKDKVLTYKKIYSIKKDEKESCLDFINRFCYTYDPRLEKNKIIPFELFPRQMEYISWLWDLYYKSFNESIEAYTDKCRDVGATWCFVAFSVFLILFRKNISITFYTFLARECHTLGKPDTLMEKAILLIKNLPEEFTDSVESKTMLITNHSTHSAIIGAAGDNPDRSLRRTFVVKDECAFYEQEELVNAALSKVSNFILNVSTHSGTNTSFYRAIVSGEFPVFTFDWWQNPKHTQSWYDNEKRKAQAKNEIHVFKREIERNALASVENILIPPEWVALLKEIDSEIRGKKIISMDVADEGSDTNSLIYNDGNVLLDMDEWSTLDPNVSARKAFYKAMEVGAEEIRYDSIGVGAGVKAGFLNILETLASGEPEIYQRALKIRLIGWSASGKVMRGDEHDFDDKRPNKDYFENAKAQAYYRLRDQIMNTYWYKSGDKYDPSQIITFKHIKNHPLFNKFISELSQPIIKLTASGKIIIDKKGKGKSPNIAEGYMISRAEVESNASMWD